MAINTMRELHSYVDFKGAKRPDQEPLPEARVRLLRHGYMASVSYIDAQVGRLMQALDRLGLRDDTIVVLTSDHGELLGSHGLFCKNFSAFEEVYNIPMVVAGPGVAEGVESDARGGLHDLCPTLLDLAPAAPISVPRPPTATQMAISMELAGYISLGLMIPT